ncbi:glutamine--fructose-6-phosphate transaminase (isomerizing) [Desulfurococcus mucosus]|uniref:Glutamine--fructose-6-phosphate aminotransferase [isomerizing] n=1 Tax=Desulfurococcus mucosus (strain ATCC 35584 / DSM 2162 / JCM 9187 / O7/1) TaxID=765177 RepID=E8RAD2_DESM0|nr:glutamine--fructose-6-phosphate transaminase (isomerizing) [Desulfurococcus mucosus]ADV64342.1 glutamine--fructose-6-phosphate transaminase [Desulfurococcus mucosus DSM 2162]
MCGIIGLCLRDKKALRLGEAIYRGLLRLEYRGYDSAGVAVVSDGKLVVLKGKGKLRDLEEKYSFTKLEGVTGIGHTRWATHGAPSDVNAHPHTDCGNVFAVVHNGVLENYLELKKALSARGHVFRSETDTEVVAHLIEEYYRETGDVYQAFRRAVAALKGAYALLMVTPLEPDKIFFARKDSPLVIGVGPGYNLVASDIPALLEHTRRIIVVRDGWVGYITPSSIHVEDASSGRLVNAADYVRIVEWDISDAEKEGYPHFMLKEIHEQPRALRSTLHGLMSDAMMGEAAEMLADADTVFVTGAGTSYHASEYFALISMRLAERPVIAFIASEYGSYVNAAGPRDVLVAVSQSGETMDTLKALRAFKKRGSRVISLTNAVDSAIARESDVAVYTRAGPEIGVAATKTFLTQTLALTWLAVETATRIGSLRGGEEMELLKELESTPKHVEESISTTSELVKKLAERIAGSKSMYYLSRGVGLPVAREGALKIKEIAYVHAEAYPAGESKHGPIALVEPSFPVVFTIPNDAELQRMLLGNIEEMRARGGVIVGVLPRGSELRERVDLAIEVPRAHWIATALTHTPPLQLLAYHVASLKGLDPDKPRNLAKTVTVE